MKFSLPVSACVLTPQSLFRAAEFKRAVETYCEHLPSLIPERWGWWEPLSRTFDENDLDSLIPENGICETVFWKKIGRNKAEGSFSVRWKSKTPGLLDTHANISFTTDIKNINQEEVVVWMKEECRRSSADFGFVDALPDYHREFAVESGSAQFGDRYRIVTHLLRHWLPDVFWGTIFGPAYVALFGIDRLLSAPAAIVEKIADDMVYVQLSKELRDVIEDPLGMQHRRNLFKRHLATDAFYETGRGYDRLERSPYGDIFKVPAFKLFDDE